MGKRWIAVATYNSEVGPVDVTHDIEELEDLQSIIEAGPDWNSLMKIEVTLSRKLYDCTVEEAASPDFDPLGGA